MSFSHKRHVYVTISEEYPKEDEMEKRWTMDQKMKNFLKDGPKKEHIWTSEHYYLHALCSLFLLLRRRRLLSATKRRTTRALLPNEDSAWWYVRFEIRWANANRKPHRRKRSNRNWTRNSRVRFAITTNRSPRNWTFNNTKG